MSEYQDLLLGAYEGELFGEAFFATMAAAESNPDRKAKLLVLQEIEARTARTLEPLARESGVPVGEGTESRRIGEELGAGSAAAGWETVAEGLNDALPDFLASFVRCRELAPDSMHPALVALVAHEQAIATFASLECAGRGDISLSPLRWYLETAS